jgi:ATP-dependent Clp protease ATP-binding subunit ClpC
MLLQIMEEGQLTDSFGRHIDFRNVILILTSNIGADLIKNKGGFGFAKQDVEADYGKMKQTLNGEIERYFRPEFINRLDDIIVFRPLTRDDLITIVEYELRKVGKRLKDRDMMVDVDGKAKDFLIEKGYNPDFGARPLRRAIEQHVEDPMSERILTGDFKEGQTIKISHEEGNDFLTFISAKTESNEQGDLAKAGAEST